VSGLVEYLFNEMLSTRGGQSYGDKLSAFNEYIRDKDSNDPGCFGGNAICVFPGAIGLVGGLAESGLVTVGRWMSTAEYSLMTQTGRMVESNLGGVTSVSFPASAAAYANAVSGSVYAEFKVASDTLRAVGSNGWAKIYGPSSIFGPRLGISEMPRVVDPVIRGTKP
jgi:hypothetical protein